MSVSAPSSDPSITAVSTTPPSSTTITSHGSSAAGSSSAPTPSPPGTSGTAATLDDLVSFIHKEVSSALKSALEDVEASIPGPSAPYGSSSTPLGPSPSAPPLAATVPAPPTGSSVATTTTGVPAAGTTTTSGSLGSLPPMGAIAHIPSLPTPTASGPSVPRPTLPSATTVSGAPPPPVTSSPIDRALLSSWLLKTPIASASTTTSSTSSAPLVLSPSLPPVPAELVAKIRAGKFIKLKELLGDNIALRQRMEEAHIEGALHQPAIWGRAQPQLRNIHSPIQWVYCMLLYMAVRCNDKTTRDLLTYARLVLHLALKHGGSGWIDYDTTFRAQAAADPSLAWNTVNPSLMASAVLNSGASGTFCHLCQEVDHLPKDCALSSWENPTRESRDPRPNPSVTGKSPSTLKSAATRAYPYSTSPSSSICRRFNRGTCPDSATTCRYRHLCNVPGCRKPHGAYGCPLRSDAKSDTSSDSTAKDPIPPA